MEPRRQICAVCGKTFTPGVGNAKYCSEACRQEGRRQRRKEWEARTDYLEKQRQAAQEYREAKAAASKQAAAASEAREATNRRRRELYRAKADAAALERQAAAGDVLARYGAAIRQGDNTTTEYWTAMQAYLLSFRKQFPATGTLYVNGISIDDPNFPDKVAMTIAELGSITEETKEA